MRCTLLSFCNPHRVKQSVWCDCWSSHRSIGDVLVTFVICARGCWAAQGCCKACVLIQSGCRLWLVFPFPAPETWLPAFVHFNAESQNQSQRTWANCSILGTHWASCGTRTCPMRPHGSLVWLVPCLNKLCTVKWRNMSDKIVDKISYSSDNS